MGSKSPLTLGCDPKVKGGLETDISLRYEEKQSAERGPFAWWLFRGWRVVHCGHTSLAFPPASDDTDTKGGPCPRVPCPSPPGPVCSDPKAPARSCIPAVESGQQALEVLKDPGWDFFSWRSYSNLFLVRLLPNHRTSRLISGHPAVIGARLKTFAGSYMVLHTRILFYQPSRLRARVPHTCPCLVPAQ